MTASPVDPFALVGSVLEGQYRIDEVVGEGGFGVVYRGWHLSFEQPIAVKVLKIPTELDATTQASVLAKFREEAKLQFVLSQASLNIVRSIGYSALNTPSGIWAPFVVLEWLVGRSLAADLDERHSRRMRGRSLAEAMALLAPAADGLAYAHSKRVAHRDVKPANLFMSVIPGDPPLPTLKVLDFGIAKVLAEETKAGSMPTKATAFSSFTPFYAAPEQFEPRLGATGPWTDVYAFALVLAEVLSDRRAIEESDPVALITRITDPVRRPTPRALGADVSDAVDAVCARALAVDPKARFSQMGDFWDALTQASGVLTTGHAQRSATAIMPSTARLSTATARMTPVPRPSYEAAPMASAPARSGAMTTPMTSVPLPSAQLASPLPSGRGPGREFAPAGSWHPPIPQPAYAPKSSSSGTTALGCIVGILLTLGVLALAAIRLTHCLDK